MTNPDNALGTNGAFGGRTSVNAFNDVLATFDGAGIVSGFAVEPDTGMTVEVGGSGTTRDVAVAEDPFGNRTTVDNISGDPIPVTIDTASTTTARIDSIVAYVNSPANASDTSVDNPTACGIIAVDGTSGGAPLDSAIRTAITADGGTGSTAYYVVIANVSVPANTTTITTSLISAGKSINLSNVATSGTNGLMSGADKAKMDTLEPVRCVDIVPFSLESGMSYAQNASFRLGDMICISCQIKLSTPLTSGQQSKIGTLTYHMPGSTIGFCATASGEYASNAQLAYLFLSSGSYACQVNVNANNQTYVRVNTCYRTDASI